MSGQGKRAFANVQTQLHLDLRHGKYWATVMSRDLVDLLDYVKELERKVDDAEEAVDTKPVLPTEDGTVILADMPLESRPLVLRDGRWWYLNGESFYHPRAVANYPWTLAKVVEV